MECVPPSPQLSTEKCHRLPRIEVKSITTMVFLFHRPGWQMDSVLFVFICGDHESLKVGVLILD